MTLKLSYSTIRSLLNNGQKASNTTLTHFSTIPHLFRKKPRIIPTFPHNLSLRNKAAKETEKERFTMASKNSNQINVPQAREAMDKFKMQAAQEMGVNLKQGYNGDLTSREAGSVGGQMVKKMIEAYESGMQ